MHRSRLRRAATAAAMVVVLSGVASCGRNGREMVLPKPGATAPPRATSTTYATTDYRPAPLLSSSAFIAGGELPVEFLCEATVPPPLSWTTIPKGTKEIVLAMYALKPSADVHWMVRGIAPSVSSFTGTVPEGATPMLNTFGTTGWSAPCTTDGLTQSYQFEVLALPAPAQITEGQTPTGVLQQLETQAGNGRGFLPVTLNPGGSATSLDIDGDGIFPDGSEPTGTLGTIPGSLPPLTGDR